MSPVGTPLWRTGPSSPYSVLDKLVPGYYHRLDPDGCICGSAFGANTAGMTAPPSLLLLLI